MEKNIFFYVFHQHSRDLKLFSLWILFLFLSTSHCYQLSSDWLFRGGSAIETESFLFAIFLCFQQVFFLFLLVSSSFFGKAWTNTNCWMLLVHWHTFVVFYLKKFCSSSCFRETAQHISMNISRSHGSHFCIFHSEIFTKFLVIFGWGFAWFWIRNVVSLALVFTCSTGSRFTSAFTWLFTQNKCQSLGGKFFHKFSSSP